MEVEMQGKKKIPSNITVNKNFVLINFGLILQLKIIMYIVSLIYSVKN